MPIDDVKEEGREPVYVNSPTNHHYFKEHDIAVYSPPPGREIERQVVVAHTPDRERLVVVQIVKQNGHCFSTGKCIEAGIRM